MNTKNNIVQLDAQTSKGDMQLAVELYQEVFGETGPWGEGYQCVSCNKLWALDVEQPAQCCEQIPEACWPDDVVRDMFLKEGNYSFVAFGEDVSGERKALGFSVGAVCTPEELEIRLKAEGLAEALQSMGQKEAVLYKSDLGVRQSSRGTSLAKELDAARRDFIGDAFPEVKVEMLRTRPGATTYGWNERNGGKIVYRYAGEDDRVLMQRGIQREGQESRRELRARKR